jgi:ribonuclease D
LKLLLKIRSKEAGVAAKLMARTDERKRGRRRARGLNILDGWRFEEFGRDALDLVEGRLAFATENGKLKMSRVAADSGTGQAA